MSKKKSDIQAVVFGNKWKAADARKWLKTNKLKPIKRVHKTKGGFMRYRIIEPDNFKKFAFKKTNRGISFVLGFR